MSKNVAVVQNPVTFMTENYMKTNVLINEFASVTLIIINKYETPYKLFLTFPDEKLCQTFIEKYNKKFFDEKINYQLEIEINNKKIQDIQNEIKNIEEKLEPYIFDYPYEDEWWLDYISQPEKSGLLYKNEEAKDKIYRAVKYLLAKSGKNLFQGKSILNISLPVWMFDKRTLHQVFAYEHRLAPYFLTRAALSIDVVERLKWVTVHLISFLHFTTIQLKPFNPILGETFQCRIGNLTMYLEHTVNHPITANFYGIDDDGLYELFGYQITDASISTNSVRASRLGYYFIRFTKDNTTFRIRIPDVFLQGIAMGDRLFSYEGKALVMDLTNKISSFIEINPREEKGGGFFKGLFKKSSNSNFPDYFKGIIINSKYIKVDENGINHTLSKGYTTICKIEGEWTDSCRFDDVEYWNIKGEKSLNMYHLNYTLRSDGSFRNDLLCFKQDKEDISQTEKEKLEVRQREDRKLRKEYAEKAKKKSKK